MVDARASGISINERRGAAAIPIPDSPECEEEWSHAREYCRDLSDRKLLGSGNYRGFGKTLEQCIRGMVPEECGGNPVARKWSSLRRMA